jgi:phospholipase C
VRAVAPEVEVDYVRGDLLITLRNRGVEPAQIVLTDNAYRNGERTIVVLPGRERTQPWPLDRSAHWYDVTATVRGLAGFCRRFAGRVETGRDSFSDPALGGPARGDQD